MKTRFSSSTHRQGFTAVEMLVATMVAAIVTGMAAVVCYAVVKAQTRFEAVATVTLPNGALSNFYGVSGNDITTVIAPNFSSVARAEQMREIFFADVAESVAVFPLSRPSGTYNTVRPSSITAPPVGTLLDTPENFRVYLLSVFGASNFTTYRNHPSTRSCFTTYMLGYSANKTNIPILAVYELDVVPAQAGGSTVGNYVSLRRYVNGTMTNYYDVIFMNSGDGTDSWYPPMVAFERQCRKAVTEGATTIDRFKIAEEKPFYLMFWPDPARSDLRLPSGNTTANLNPSWAATDPRKAYNHMGGRTAFMFVVPMFPSS